MEFPTSYQGSPVSSAGPAPDKPPPSPSKEEEAEETKKSQEANPVYDLPEKFAPKQQVTVCTYCDMIVPRPQGLGTRLVT